jgi:DNA-binding winged helix-turn-helix (wHTH) protein/tetratricopeptide (TPR) repeat protein
VSPPAHTVLRFLDYTLDPTNAQVRRGQQVVDVRPKTLAVLTHLAAHPQRLITKRELIEAVWADTAVTEWVLTSCIRELRDALGDDARQPRLIETVHGRGYRFIADTAPVPSPESPTVLSAASSVLSRGARALSTQDSALSTVLLGRDADLTALAGCWQEALAGERQIVFVVGEAGMGKTALVEEFRRHVGGTVPALLAHGQCIEQRGAGEPYLPVLEALGRVCFPPNGAVLVELLRRHAPAWLVQLPGVLEPAECEALERRLGATTRERMLREMAAFLAALPDPLVLVLEDLHWSDHATLDLVSTLAQRRDPARLLLIGTYRPVEVAVRNHPLRTVHQDLRAHGRCRDLWLAPLTDVAVAQYLEHRWPGLPTAALAAAVHERTDGNPLFLVNLVDYLAASGAVTHADGGWRLRGDAAALAATVPPGVRSLIAAHIERLDEAERTVIEAGSVAGRRFSAALVAAALETDVVAVEERLTRLADHGLMVSADGASEWPDGTLAGAYRFNHSLYQSVLRDRVPPARRRQLHARIAACVERAYARRLEEVNTELAFHLEAAGQAERAVPFLEDAAARAIRRGANHEAVLLLEHGLEIVDPLPRTAERTLRTIRLCMSLGPALTPARGYGDPEIERVYERARRLSEERDDPVQLFQALVALTGTYTAQARFDRARDTAQQLEPLMARFPLAPFVFAGSLLIGVVQYHTGSLSDVRRLLEQALVHEDIPLPPLSTDMRVIALSYLALTLTHQGHPNQACAMLQQAIARAATIERPFDRSFAAQGACFVHLILHDMDSLALAADEAAALDDFPAIAAIGRLSRGRVLSARGEHAQAIATMREALDAYRATGQRIALPTLLAALAEGHIAAGQTPAAQACIAEARAAAESAGEIRYLAELHRLEGTLHATANDRPAADRCLRRAMTMAREQGARGWELRATTSWARLALAPGTRPHTRRACRAALAPLVASFTEGRDTPDLLDAESVLRALG